jgi:hypothetical protein
VTNLLAGQARNRCSIIGKGNKFFSFCILRGLLWSPPSLLFNGCRVKTAGPEAEISPALDSEIENEWAVRIWSASCLYSSHSDQFTLTSGCYFSVFAIHYRHSQTYAELTLRKDQRKWNFAQVGIDYTYGQLHTHVRARTHTCTHARESSGNPDSNTLEPEWPRHNRPTACIIAQQYTPVTFSLRCHSRKEKFGAYFKRYYLFLFTF